MQIISLFLALILAASVTGCGIAAKMRARDDMEESKVAYKQCLRQHSQDLPQCEAFKRVFEADMATYRATSSGMRPGMVLDVQDSK
jgi:hypothetical protein